MGSGLVNAQCYCGCCRRPSCIQVAIIISSIMLLGFVVVLGFVLQYFYYLPGTVMISMVFALHGPLVLGVSRGMCDNKPRPKIAFLITSIIGFPLCCLWTLLAIVLLIV